FHTKHCARNNILRRDRRSRPTVKSFALIRDHAHRKLLLISKSPTVDARFRIRSCEARWLCGTRKAVTAGRARYGKYEPVPRRLCHLASPGQRGGAKPRSASFARDRAPTPA